MAEASGADIGTRFGHVVVRQLRKMYGGVVQYDFGKTTLSGFERTGSLYSPPQVLPNAVAKVQTHELRSRSQLSTDVSN